MNNFVNHEIFTAYQKYIDNEQEIREKIRTVVREIEQSAKTATIQLQIIHSDILKINQACTDARKQIELCSEGYAKLAALIPVGQYYRYSDHWTYITQRLVFLIALVVYLEAGFLVTRETVAEMLGLKTSQKEGFHLDIEDYLMGILQMASELSRFATNSVTLGDYDRPLNISRFIADLNSGFRLLNLKNDALRKRFDALKYDVKKIEEVIYDISIRGLKSSNCATEADDNIAEPVKLLAQSDNESIDSTRNSKRNSAIAAKCEIKSDAATGVESLSRQCAKCGQLYTTRWNMLLHTKRCCGAEPLSRKCAKCGLIFSSHDGLIRHMKKNRCQDFGEKDDGSRKKCIK